MLFSESIDSYNCLHQQLLIVCLSFGQVWLEKRYVGSKLTSEWFNTAGRSVKTGFIASVIVSQVQYSP